MIVATAYLHTAKPELKFCAGSNPGRGVLDFHDGEDLWQWSRSRLETRLSAYRRLTIPQKQLIIFIIISIMKIQYHLWDKEEFMKKYTTIYNNTSKLEGYRLKITVWLVKAKPCKWLRRAFRWCFWWSYNKNLLGFLRNLSDIRCNASDTFKILVYSAFRYIQVYSSIFSIIKGH